MTTFAKHPADEQEEQWDACAHAAAVLPAMLTPHFCALHTSMHSALIRRKQAAHRQGMNK